MAPSTGWTQLDKLDFVRKAGKLLFKEFCMALAVAGENDELVVFLEFATEEAHAGKETVIIAGGEGVIQDDGERLSRC